MSYAIWNKCESQSPDGDFFDPESESSQLSLQHAIGHSPLTGIFLIRRPQFDKCAGGEGWSQSPDGDFFDPEGATGYLIIRGAESQSPDGDFFDPESQPSVLRTAKHRVTVP